MAAPMMAPNGTRFGGWLLNTADNTFGPVGDFDGDGKAEILVTSPWGIGVLKLAGNTFAAPMMAPNGTRFGGWLLNTARQLVRPGRRLRRRRQGRDPRHEPLGGRHAEADREQLHGPMMAAERDALRRVAAEHAGTTGSGTGADYDGDGKAELLVTSPWGIGILEQSGATMAAPTMKPNGTRFGGWLLNTLDNDLGHGA